MSSLSLPITAPQAPPKSFHPRTATDGELAANSYPPRPDQFKAPNLHALWESVAVREPEYIRSNFVERPAEGLDEIKNWAGAVIRATPTGKPAHEQSLRRAVGTWKVPIITPTKDGSGKTIAGSYRIWSWVGTDGWENEHALKVGTSGALEVDSNGVVTSESHTAAILFRGPKELGIRVYEFQNFPVSAGDEIIGAISGEPGSTGPYNAWVFKVSGKVPIYSTGKVEGVDGIKREGLTTDWVQAGLNPDSRIPYHLPHFEPNIYRYLFALRTNEQEVGADRGFLFDAEDLPIQVTRFGFNSLLFTNEKA